MGRQETLNRMVASISKISFALNFIMKAIFICYYCFQLLEL